MNVVGEEEGKRVAMRCMRLGLGPSSHWVGGSEGGDGVELSGGLRRESDKP